MPTPPVLILDAAEQARAPFAAGLRDLWAGLRAVELWGAMGSLDVRRRYSRSVLGPFWVTLSLAVFVGGIGIVYGALFKQPLETYLPFLTVGMVLWTFLTACLLEGCSTFIAAEAAIKQLRAPLAVYAYRLVWRSLLVLAHNAAIVAIVLVAFGAGSFTGLPAAAAGLALLVANGCAFALTLGVLSARFRDIPPLMANVVQTLFFLTPILWRAEALGGRRWVADLNPFHALVDIVRAPLLGEPTAPGAWAVAGSFTALNLLVAAGLYARFRWRVPYWL